METKATLIRLPVKLWKKIHKQSYKTGQSKNSIVVEACTEKFEKKVKKDDTVTG